MNRWRIRTISSKRGQNLVKGYNFDSKNEKNKDNRDKNKDNRDKIRTLQVKKCY